MRPRAREGRAYGEGEGVCCQDTAKALFLVPCPSAFYLSAHTGNTGGEPRRLFLPTLSPA